jgi:hypothetical protein
MASGLALLAVNESAWPTTTRIFRAGAVAMLLHAAVDVIRDTRIERVIAALQNVYIPRHHQNLDTRQPIIHSLSMPTHGKWSPKKQISVLSAFAVYAVSCRTQFVNRRITDIEAFQDRINPHCTPVFRRCAQQIIDISSAALEKIKGQKNKKINYFLKKF